MKAKKMQLQISEVTQVSTSVSMFIFEPKEDFVFTAGQYIQVTLPHDADERGTTRFFSIASSPSEKHIMLTTKRGSSSFKKKLFSLQQGDVIEVFGPIGKFTLED